MSDEHPHPITTPKGAAAITILLGVVSVFAPFLFDRSGALLCAFVAGIVILWIYWREAREALERKAWSQTLTVPVVVILMMVGMAITAANHGPDQPKPVPTLNVDDIAKRVAVAMRADQSMNPPQPAPVQAPAPARSRIEIVQIPPPASHPSPPPQATVADNDLVASLKANYEAHELEAAKRKKNFDCEIKLAGVEGGFVGLLNQAANSENSFARYKTDNQMVGDYNSWIERAEAFVAENKPLIGDVSGFESADEQDKRPTFLLVHNSGVHAFNKMDAKRVVLNNIYQKIQKYDCSSGVPLPPANG